MNYLSPICILYLLYVMLFHSQTIIQISQSTIDLWIHTLIPSLFLPTLFLRVIFDDFPNIKTNFLNIYNFRYILIGWLFGYPNFAIYLEEQCQQGHISSESCKRLLYCINICSLPFLFVTIGHHLIIQDTILLCTSIIFSNICLLLITKNIRIDSNYKNYHQKLVYKIKTHLFKTLSSLFLMGGYILICYSLFAFIPKIALINWFLEFSSGCLQVLQQPSYFQLPLLGSIISFGSISIHLQIFSSLETIKIRYTNYLMYRIFQSMITFLTILFIQFFF